MAAFFTAEALKFLRGLARHNDREWFGERKKIYEQELKKPMLALIAEVNDRLGAFAPEHVRAPEKTMMRIYRDVRFSTNKSPYKTEIAAWWARTGMEKTSAGGFYFSLGASRVLVAAGVYQPDKMQTLAIRRHLVTHHATFRKILDEKKMKENFLSFEGLPLKRAPKGFGDAEVPEGARDLVRCRQWGVAATLRVEMALGEGLGAEIARRFRIASPLVALLNEPLQTKVPRPMF